MGIVPSWSMKNRIKHNILQKKISWKLTENDCKVIGNDSAKVDLEYNLKGGSHKRI